MAAYRQVYDSRHLQADYQEPGSAPEPYVRQSSIGYLYFFYFWLFTLSQKKTICNPLAYPTWKYTTLTCEVLNFFLSDWRFALYLRFPVLAFSAPLLPLPSLFHVIALLNNIMLSYAFTWCKKLKAAHSAPDYFLCSIYKPSTFYKIKIHDD